MNLDQEVARLTEIVRADPNDQEARSALANLLIATLIQSWPSGDQLLDTKYYRDFLHTMAIPVATLADGITTLEVADFLFQISGGLHWVGQHEDSEEYAKRALQIREEITKGHPLHNTNIRFFQTRTGIRTQFGHLVVEPETFIRTGELGWRDTVYPILCMPQRKCANPALLRYWQKYICVITDPYLSEYLEPTARSLEYNTFWMKVPNVGIRYGHSGIIAAITEWERRGLPPVLELDPRHKEEGWKFLRQQGVPDGGWFVVTQVRHATSHVTDKVAIRNSDVSSYLEAYRQIVARGGWVVRIGDSRMPAIPPFDNVLDLTRWEDRPDWLDLFLVAESRFFLGSASGPCSLTATFQTPLVMANIPANCFPVSERDIFVPKLLRCRRTCELLHFRESLTPKFQYLFNGKIYEELGVEVVENDPQDLAAAAMEMLERIEGTISYTEEDLILRSRFDALASALEGRPIKCGLARDFARKHRSLIVE